MRCARPSVLIALLAAVAIVVAGCGGGSTTTTTSSAGGAPTEAQIQQEQRDATRFVACMRTHGVSIPNPAVAPRGFKSAFQTPSAAFRSGYTACGHLLPAGRSNQSPPSTQAQTVALLAFARCLRSHGFPSFPDPTSSGQLTHEMVAKARIDLHQPALVAAADACTGVTHGVITRAVVARFVAGH